jgi:hypothetical protein
MVIMWMCRGVSAWKHTSLQAPTTAGWTSDGLNVWRGTRQVLTTLAETAERSSW